MGDTILRVDDIQKFYGNKGNLTKAMRIADHHDLRRVDWRKHSACYEQNVSFCNAL